MTTADRPTDAAMRDRFYQEIADDLDEELELELDDSRLDELLDR